MLKIGIMGLGKIAVKMPLVRAPWSGQGGLPGSMGLAGRTAHMRSWLRTARLT